MNTRKTVETTYGTIDADMLAMLQQSFVTSELLSAVNTIETGEGRQKWLRSNLLRLYAMTSHLIDGAPKTVTGKEPIWQLAEEIADELDAYSTEISHITKLVDQLGRLRPNDDSMPGAPT